MPNKIVLKKSSVASKVPVVTDLDYGELALNYADGKLYYKKSDGTTIDSFSAGAGSSITITNDNSTNATRYLVWEDATSGNVTTVGVSSTKLTFNPSTGDLGSTNFNSLSDANKKEDIETIINAIELLMHLRGVFFRWKDTKQRSMGVIAQEIEAVIPEVVVTLDDGTKTVSYGNIVGLLIEAVKNHEERIIKLETLTAKLYK